MRAPCIYVCKPLACDSVVSLTGKQHHYIAHVLRLLPGDIVYLFNGDGKEYQSRLRVITRHRAELSCESVRCGADGLKSSLAIELFLAVAKSHSMDLALQKATELEVCNVQPVITEYSQHNLRSDFEKKRRHWQEVVISAAEQCARVTVPAIRSPVPLSDITPPDEAVLLALIPGAAESLVTKLQSLQDQPPSRLVLLIGPEGDFSEHDKALITRLGFIPVHIGRHILRVETAALTAIVLAQALWGDLAQSFVSDV